MFELSKSQLLISTSLPCLTLSTIWIQFQTRLCEIPLAIEVIRVGMAFCCGQNIHIIKYEMGNTNVRPNQVNVSYCINTKPRILKKSPKRTKFEVEKKINMKSTQKMKLRM